MYTSHVTYEVYQDFSQKQKKKLNMSFDQLC